MTNYPRITLTWHEFELLYSQKKNIYPHNYNSFTILNNNNNFVIGYNFPNPDNNLALIQYDPVNSVIGIGAIGLNSITIDHCNISHCLNTDNFQVF